MRFTQMLWAVGVLVSMSTVTGQSFAQSVPPEVSQVAKLLNVGRMFELRPTLGVKYDEASLNAEPIWYAGARIVASPRKWLGVEGTISFDVPGHHKPRMEAATWIRF